ncbi:hypothetical protein [Duganella sp. CF458]|uniref:hypothetical protein n=1 Tax=Duganella sp. CF458 TaxID=1884368 RepID=UPI001113C0DF|nr:hypothetical protein [Duganella sp. CF458]
MKHADLPDRWKTRLTLWIRQFSDDERTELAADDFPVSHYVSLKFEDDSEAKFEHALVIEEPKLDEVGVFTEHCGYHIFPLGGTHVARIQK